MEQSSRQSNADISSGHADRALTYARHIKNETAASEAMRRVVAHGAAAIAAAMLEVADAIRESR